jgi:DNA-binding SARP family transcriptional activator
MSDLRVRAFGAVTATLAGVPLDLGGPRQRAVLGLLAASGQRVVSTDRFLEDLWGGEPPPKALSALQSYVSRLRTLLEPDRGPREPARVLVSSSPGYLLDLPDEAVDVWEFAALCRTAGSLADPAAVVETADRALALWTDEPFGAYADDEWAALEATRLAGLRTDLVETRAAAALDLDRAGEVARDLEPHVRDHPLHERGVRLLATAYYRLGRQGEALAALSGLRERLVDELGLDPGPELRELETAILNHDPALRVAPRVAASAPVPAASAPTPAEDDVLGRAAELARLHAAAAAVAGPTLVWVTGEAGIGKTTLVERFCDESVSSWRIARGRCPEVDGAPPGWAWAEALAELRGTAPDPAAVRGLTPFDLAHELAHELQGAVADGHGALVVLDDLHRADGETLQVLRHLLAAVRRPLLVVATFRPDEAGPDLGLTVAAVADRTGERIDLAGLDDEAALALLRASCPTELPEATWAALVERAGGSPLFLRQVGRLAASEGAQLATTGLPSAIRDILDRRLVRLPAATVDLLSRAAVLGRDIDLDLVVACEAERDLASEDEVVDALDAGIVAGLVVVDAPGSLSFAHALVRDALYDRLPPMRRHRLHATALAVLERIAPDATGALAHHAAASLDARSAAHAVPLLERAAADALRNGANAEAVRHARAALAAHDLAGTAEQQRLDVRRLLVQGLASSGDLAGAHAERQASIEAAARWGDARQAVLAMLWETATAWTIRELQRVDRPLVARLQAAADELRAADRDAVDERLLVDVLATLALETEGSDLVDVAEAAAAEAVERARALGDPEALCRALNGAYLVAYPPRRDGLLLEVATDLLAASREAGLLSYEAVAHSALFGAYAGAGDLVRAEEHVVLARSSGTASQLPLTLAVSGLFQGLKLLVHGQVETAATVYEQVTALMAASGDPNGAAMSIVLGFTAAHAAGDTSTVLPGVEQLAAYGSVELVDYQVCCLLDAGRDDEARAHWRPDRDPRRDYFWLFNATLRGELAARLGDVEVAARYEQALTPWAGRFAGLVSGAATLGPVDHVLGLLARVRGDEETALAHFAGAAALAEQYGATQWAERARKCASSG